jgi:hypothetical protein
MNDDTGADELIQYTVARTKLHKDSPKDQLWRVIQIGDQVLNRAEIMLSFIQALAELEDGSMLFAAEDGTVVEGKIPVSRLSETAEELLNNEVAIDFEVFIPPYPGPE